MSTFLAVLAISFAVHASGPAKAPCNAAEVKKKLPDATPRETADLFVGLAACDAGAAKSLAPAAFQKILGGEDGVPSAQAAIRIGAGQAVRDWLNALLADERSVTLAGLGRTCSSDPGVVTFFVDSQKTMGDTFWRERWQRGLAECKEPAAQDLLRNALNDPVVQRDPSRFGSILEAFCRNTGKAAIPFLKSVALTTKAEDQIAVIGAFSDAAGVGTMTGTDAEAAKQAISSIQEIAPQLQPKAVEQARVVLESLGDADSARKLAAVRYAATKRPDGFHWGLVTVEKATCKNGKLIEAMYTGQVVEPGHYWADQLSPAAQDAMKTKWKMDAGKKCKGESSFTTTVSAEPFADDPTFDTWKAAQLRPLYQNTVDKRTEYPQPVIKLP
jgi:hypothetical protein